MEAENSTKIRSAATAKDEQERRFMELREKQQKQVLETQSINRELENLNHEIHKKNQEKLTMNSVRNDLKEAEDLHADAVKQMATFQESYRAKDADIKAAIRSNAERLMQLDKDIKDNEAIISEWSANRKQVTRQSLDL